MRGDRDAARATVRARRLALCAVVTFAASCAEPAADTASSAVSPVEPVRVGVLFDIGGRGDGGFNDGAVAGAERATATGGVHVEYAEAGDGTERAAILRTMAEGRPDAIIAIGFLASHDATIVAREFPDVHFTVIDYAVPLDSAGRAVQPPPNLAGVTFREEEGAYLVGAIAALTSRSRTVGFVGGMESPMIHRFEAGFAAGVHRVCERCVVLSRFVGTTPAAFNDPAAGRRVARELFGGGADVVFHAAGATGGGVIAAAREEGRFAIGVDVDQWQAAPGRVLTSMVKRIDVAVVEAIARERRGAFRPGMTSLGLAEGGVGYVFDANNERLLPAGAREHAETLRAAVVAGLLSVPTVR